MLPSISFSVVRSALFLCFLSILERAAAADRLLLADCILKRNSVLDPAIQDDISGRVSFRQVAGGKTTIDVTILGFTKKDVYTSHGFHIHELNNTSDGCNSLGGHYNPTNVDHGAPADLVRHFGDLGNVEESTAGKVVDTKKDRLVTLSGKFSVIGRSVVVHQKEDDLGRGGDQGSLTTGNAGARLGCCIIKEIPSGAQARHISALLMTSCIALFFKMYL